MAKQLDLCDSFPINTKVAEKNKSIVLNDSGEAKPGVELICNVAATHSGTLINNRVYPPKGMKKGIKTWTSPYKKPVLVNHDAGLDPIGRVIRAKYIKTERALGKDEYSPILKTSDGYGYVGLSLKVTDQDAIEKILDGRYNTVSVRMSTTHAYCSICDADWAVDGPCDHYPGKHYEDGKKLAYITTGDLSYREVSFVNIPADEYAGVEDLGSDSVDESGSIDVEVYANNTEDKTLCDLNDEDGNNLYDYLEDGTDEEEEVIVHLIDKLARTNKSDENKEDQMSKEKELTKDQLRELDAVKELIQEATDKANEDHKEPKQDANCEDVLKELQECKEGKDACETAQKALAKEKDSLEKERDQLKDELEKREEDGKKLLDENVDLNAQLHKLNAERLYDLKNSLDKPDVADIKTTEDRTKKVDELAQRSIDSLKDQINDLLIERASTPGAPRVTKKVDNPGIEHEDTGEVEEKIEDKKETKKDTLDRLFGSDK